MLPARKYGRHLGKTCNVAEGASKPFYIKEIAKASKTPM